MTGKIPFVYYKEFLGEFFFILAMLLFMVRDGIVVHILLLSERIILVGFQSSRRADPPACDVDRVDRLIALFV